MTEETKKVDAVDPKPEEDENLDSEEEDVASFLKPKKWKNLEQRLQDMINQFQLDYRDEIQLIEYCGSWDELETDWKMVWWNVPWIKLVVSISPKLAWEFDFIANLILGEINSDLDITGGVDKRPLNWINNPLLTIPECVPLLLRKFHLHRKLALDITRLSSIRFPRGSGESLQFLKSWPSLLQSIKESLFRVDECIANLEKLPSTMKPSWKKQFDDSDFLACYQGVRNSASQLLGTSKAAPASLEGDYGHVRKRRSYSLPADVNLAAYSEYIHYEETGHTSPLLEVNCLGFPPSFYPASYTPKLKAFLYDPNTLWLVVLLLSILSAFFAGLSFLNTKESPLHTPLSQTFRIYAALWCMMIPLFRDRTLPIWPARAWLYATVGLSASLCIVSTILCKFLQSWSELVMLIAEFTALAATGLLAMGVVEQRSSRIGTRTHVD